MILHIRTSLLSDIYATAGYSHGRATTSLLQSLTGSSSHDVLPRLGALHRACVWENIVLKAGLGSPGTELTAARDMMSPELQTPPTVTASGTPNMGQADTSAGPSGATNGIPGDSSSISAPKQEATRKEVPKEQNVKILKHLASQIPSALAPFFQGMWRICQ